MLQGHWINYTGSKKKEMKKKKITPWHSMILIKNENGIYDPFFQATNVHCQKMNPFCDIKCEMCYGNAVNKFTCQEERQSVYMHVFLYPSAITMKPNMFEANKSGQISSFSPQCNNEIQMNKWNAGLTGLTEGK